MACPPEYSRLSEPSPTLADSRNTFALYPEDESTFELLPFETDTTTSKTNVQTNSTSFITPRVLRTSNKNAKERTWSNQPGILRRSYWDWLEKISINIVLMLIPLPFFIMAVIVATIHTELVNHAHLAMLESAGKGVCVPY
jgi:hypothetical protein